MPTTAPPSGFVRADPLFDGPGEMRALCRAFDWEQTALGPSDRWPLSLRTTVATLLASRHPMFLFWGPELVQVYNDAYRPSLAEGGRHPQALGMRGAEFWTDIWHIIGPQIDQVMAGGEATWHEDHLVPIIRNHRLEEVYWTYSYGPAFDDRGQVGGVLVVCQETTPRVFTERRLQQHNAELHAERARLLEAFRRVPSFTAVVTGPEHTFMYANDAYQELVGGRELVGRPAFEALPEVRGQGFEELLTSVRESGEPVVGREALVRVRSGAAAELQDRYVNFVYQALRDVDGETWGVLVHGVDVTDSVLARREVERLLAESEAARREAESANRAKADFLAMMSHELRTPLNAIQGHAELLEMGMHGALTPGQLEAVRRIERSQRHLLGLVNGVLNFARIESGRLEYHMTSVPVSEMLATCEALMAPEARRRDLTLDCCTVDPALHVRADPEKLQQILLNLLANAMKFTAAGGSVWLTCDADERAVRLRVRDSGRGIPANQLARIFEPFVQVDVRLTRTEEGMGLGLAISRELARGMGGELLVASEPGVGSEFTVVVSRAS